jgi:hypothetical protein
MTRILTEEATKRIADIRVQATPTTARPAQRIYPDDVLFLIDVISSLLLDAAELRLQVKKYLETKDLSALEFLEAQIK